MVVLSRMIVRNWQRRAGKPGTHTLSTQTRLASAGYNETWRAPLDNFAGEIDHGLVMRGWFQKSGGRVEGPGLVAACHQIIGPALGGALCHLEPRRLSSYLDHSFHIYCARSIARGLIVATPRTCVGEARSAIGARCHFIHFIQLSSPHESCASARALLPLGRHRQSCELPWPTSLSWTKVAIPLSFSTSPWVVSFPFLRFVCPVSSQTCRTVASKFQAVF